jgi:hypothetical protein
MNGLMDDLRILFVQSLRAPQEAARQLIAMGVPMQARWLGFALATVLSLVLVKLSLATLPVGELSDEGLQTADPFTIRFVMEYARLMNTPVASVLIQAGSILVMVGAVGFGGRLFGGHGRLADALLLTVWLDLMMSVFVAAQLLLLFALPPAAVLLSYVAKVFFIWLLVNFTAALHGFKNLFGVLGGMIAIFALVVVVLGVILAILGVSPPEGSI